MPDLPDFDVEVDAAWTRFSARLSCYFAAMRPGDTLAICTTSGRLSYGDHDLSLTITGTSDGTVRADVTVRRTVLQMMSGQDRIMLARAGWDGTDSGEPSALQSLELHVTASPEDTDSVASAVVTLLREIRGVTHPSFLAASAVGRPPTSVFDTDSVLDDWDAPTPHSRLVSEVNTILESIMSSPPTLDRDGHVPFVFDCGTAYLRVLETEPVVELSIVFEIDPRCRNVGSVVSAIAPAWPDVHFHLGEGHVMATARIDCSPLVEEHLGRRLGMFIRFVAEEGDGLAARLKEEVRGATSIPAELLTLLHLDPESAGDLLPADVALICGNDRDAILEFMRLCTIESAAWTDRAERALANGDADDTAFRHEAESWRRTEVSLRKALRFVALDLPRRTTGMRHIKGS